MYVVCMYVSEGDKRLGSVTGGVQNHVWGLGQSPQKPKNYAENLIECKNSIRTLFREKIPAWQFWTGTCPIS